MLHNSQFLHNSPYFICLQSFSYNFCKIKNLGENNQYIKIGSLFCRTNREPEAFYDETESSSILEPAIKVMTNAWTSLKSPIKSLLRLEKREAHGVEIMLFLRHALLGEAIFKTANSLQLERFQGWRFYIFFVLLH